MKSTDEAPAKGMTRGEFLRGATLAGAASAVGILTGGEAVEAALTRPAPKPARWAMLVDLRKCVGCYGCQVACKQENEVPLGKYRNWVKLYEEGSYPNFVRHMQAYFCNHCDKPPCVPVCPADATYKREDGAVLIDYDKCINCGRCVAACPYGARFLNPVTQTADKCSFCDHRIDEGLPPACAQACPGRALLFGDLKDPKSEIAQKVAANRDKVKTLLPELGTEPQVFYIPMFPGEPIPNR